MNLQRPEILKIGNDEYEMWKFPLEDYWERVNLRLDFEITASCLRGYIGTWQIINNELIFLNIEGKIEGWLPVDIEYFFPDFMANPVVATWFSGTLEISLGEVIKIENELPTKYGRELVLIIEHGKIIHQSIAENYLVVNSQIDISNFPIDKVLDLYHKNNPLNLKNIEPKSEILDTSSFVLRVNGHLPKFYLISELLERNFIPFESCYIGSWDDNLSSHPIEMSFSPKCRFRDVYLLASWLKEFGIEVIYPARTQNSFVVIGTTFFQVYNLGNSVLAESISIDSFLKIDPNLDTQKVIDLYFTNLLEIVVEDEIYEAEENVDEIGDDQYSLNWKKDTFDAMTDGQLGDWNDFPGDIDDLLDWTGRSQ